MSEKVRKAVKKERSAATWRKLAFIAVAATALIALAVSIASAAPVGQTESWGTYGTANGQLANGVMVGVDPVSGNVYTGDLSAPTVAKGDRESWRIQKFSPTGTFEASVLIPRYLDPGKDTKGQTILGIAVDHSLGRIYVVVGSKEREGSSGEYIGTKILVFSTTPSGTTLVPPSGGPTSIALPTTGTEVIWKPKAVAVDPTTHEVEVLGLRKAAPHVAVLQRYTSAGVAAKRFTDTENHLLPSGEFTNASSIAISPITGATYALTYYFEVVGGPEHAVGWEIPSTMNEIKPIPGFGAAAESESWPHVTAQRSASQLTLSPQIAVSPDGKTLYFKEEFEAAEETTGGNFVVHGFSLPEQATTVVYGGVTGCKIETPSAGIGVTGEGAAEKVVVYDYGQYNESEPEAPKYGGKVLTFGRGGKACPAPTAKFKANGTESNLEVATGSTVSFDASGSELASGPSNTPGFRRELIWKFGDGTEEVVKSSGSTEALATASHKYTAPGTYKATLQIHLKTPTYGNPILVERTITVTGSSGPKNLKLKVTKEGGGTVTSSPAGINCGATCEAEFEEGSNVTLKGVAEAGFKAPTWSGCTTVNSSNECEVTMTTAKEVKVVFAAIPSFTLKVTKEGNGSGTITSSPTGINCGSTCEAPFAEGTKVTLTATPEAGTKAVVWVSGCTEIAVNKCETTVTAAATVKASFTLEQHLLKVTKEGSGTVVSTPAGINCGSTCEATFNHGTSVTLKGTPEAGFKAPTWSGCTTVNGSNECEVTMSAAKEVKATFAAIPSFTLKVSKEGNGSGTVTSSPTGINCGLTCEAKFQEGTKVTLTATPEAGTKAVVWGPGCTEIAVNKCEMTVTAAATVKASFTLEQHLLKVTKEGTGTVVSTPAGINCGSTCEASFDHGTAVKLAATPGAGFKAATWTGCDKVTAGECEVTMTAAKEVKATFAAIPTFTLKVSKEGNGSGTVTSSPTGINCGSTCEAKFEEGTKVTLKATPDAGSKAVVWSGCTTVNGSNECEVTINAATTVKASFTLEQHLLKVTKEGTGTVTSSPAGINCGSTCEASFNHGTLVTLTATPGAGFKGVAFSGCDGVSGNECEVTVNAAREVKVTFTAIPQFTLTVTKEGNGSGTIMSSPAGINCGSTCEANFAEGTKVTLKATPAAGSEAAVFTGCDKVTAGECEVTMSAAKEVKATFTKEVVPPVLFKLKVTKDGTGSGTVTSNPSGINCGSTCEAEFEEGTKVTLKGTPAAGSEAATWTGCDKVTAGECEVTMTAAKEVKATFTKEVVAPTFFKLKVGKNGTGSGTVTSNPGGINCGSTCESEFEAGTLVTLKGTQDSGSSPVVFTGCDKVNASGECEVTLNSAKEITATFAKEGGVGPVDCTGGNIAGAGSTLQEIAQKQVWIPGFKALCPGITVTYEGTGSGAGLNAWGFNGGSFDSTKAFIGTDIAPNAGQIANAEAASGSKVLIVPVAQTAIAVVVNAPANCEIEEITNKQLESVFRGTIKNWGKIETASGPGCVGAPITRVVRSDGSGTTYQFKNYLFQANNAPVPCTEGTKTWKELEDIGTGNHPNIDWPQNGVAGCTATQVSGLIAAPGTGGSSVVETVNATAGSIGYSALPDVEAAKSGNTTALKLQNNGLVKLANATFASPVVIGASEQANCQGARYGVPAGARSVGGSGESVDWSQVFGAKVNIGGESYPLCMLTYDIALKNYSKAGFSQATETTVHSYLAEYITATAGQQALGSAHRFYAPVPSTKGTPQTDVLGAAQLAASKIGF